MLKLPIIIDRHQGGGGSFLLGIPFFFLEILTFLYCANEGSDDVIGGFTKTVQHSIKNISKKQNGTYYFDAMATLLALAPFRENNHLHLQSFKWDRGSSSEYT